MQAQAVKAKADSVKVDVAQTPEQAVDAAKQQQASSVVKIDAASRPQS
jgi:hypothetical protein